MERLTYKGTPYMTENGMITPAYSDYSIRSIIERLAEYEDAEEQGVLLKLPCKVGDTVYCLTSGNTKVVGCTVLWVKYTETE